MSKLELISKQTRTAFREHFVSWTVRTIADEFDAAEVECHQMWVPPCSGARRSLVEKYYHSIDFSNPQDVRKILQVYASVLQNLDHQLEHSTVSSYLSPAQIQGERSKLMAQLAKDGWQYKDGKIERLARSTGLDTLERHVAVFDLEHMRREIDRLRTSVETDPGHAIGTAKELVESCCKTILSELKVSVEKCVELMPLVKLTVKQLKLTPDDIDNAVKGAEIVRQLLHKLGGLTHELGELRNLYGSGHGRDGKFKGLQPRHARLAVGTAGTLATFLFETHLQRSTETGRKG